MYWQRFLSIIAGLIFLSALHSGVKAQVSAVPFLLHSPDSRTSSMGEAGVALGSDANSLSNNPSKLAFADQTYGFSLSYNPWLKALVSDINLGYVSSFYKLSERNTLGASIRYFSLGEVRLTDVYQQDLGIHRPNEFAIDVSLARKYGESFSLATSLRYIRSDIGAGQYISGDLIKAGTALAADISAYYRQETIILGSAAVIAAGAYVSNIGTKLSYTDGTIPYFLPANLKIGAATTFLFGKDTELSVLFDLNKLLVPSVADSLNAANDTSVPRGILNSFIDAPGGFKGEMNEISIATGVEYLYKQQFAVRGGYNSRHFTIGAGFKYDVLGVDVAYLMASPDKSPFANSLRFTLLLNFKAINK
ncbi:type IX secretion system outer membrane channel protein PorV [Pedobacter immunditicola]|uniref:type IX secretion system outer membrane channel protein PorV n=1 Tax=Pedobacter immunditicola TaxID=3133440 RepID=UPI0030B59BB7